MDIFTHLPDWLHSDALFAWLRALVLFVVGLAVVRFATRSAGRAAAGRWNAQGAMLARRTVSVLGWTLLAATVLNQLGFKLSVLMGAAGVLTVAVGFASQTAASNLISGLFLIGERPFVVGDVIKVDDVTGEVTDIDLVSVKLRTFDNLLVRVPNEALLKSKITNLTHYPIRRMDLEIGVSYSQDVEQVIEVLRDTADRIPGCLDEPEPIVIHKGYGDSAVLLQFSAWASRPRFIEVRTRLLIDIKKAFDANGIVIPFPQRTLHTATTDPPVRIAPERSTDDDEGMV